MPSCEVLHGSPHNIYSPFITRIQFLECVLESFPKQIMSETQPAVVLPYRATCEQAVGHCASLNKILEPRNYLFLVHDVVETLWPVLLSPESGFQSDLSNNLMFSAI